MEPAIYPRDQHSISRELIDPDAIKIMYRLIRNGHKAFLVGGGVRDLLLGKRPKDFDISTDATPRKVKMLFRNCRIIGRRFKLCHIFFPGGKNIEVSTFRATGEPVDEVEGAELPITHDNTYGTEETDAIRRDITINGLFYDLASLSIIDYVGGMKDLQTGIIRVIGNPDVRYTEDPIRMVRVVRHAARAGFRIEAEAWAGIEQNRAKINLAAPMRLYEEIKKDLSSGHLLSILRLLRDVGLLEYFLPALAADDGRRLRDIGGLAASLEHLDHLMTSGQPPSVTVCLSLFVIFGTASAPFNGQFSELFVDTEELEQTIANFYATLAVPRKERERIYSLLELWSRLTRGELSASRLAALPQRPYFDDLSTLLTCSNQTDLIGQIHQAVTTVGEPPRGRRRRRSRSRRTRR